MRAFVVPIVASLSGLLLSCSSNVTLENGTAAFPEAAKVRYSLVYIVHGDGEYVYHDRAGVPHRADKEALSGALLVGERSADAEVFVFYQKPQKRTLFFGGDDGDFWYFRNGKTLVTTSYSRDDPDFKQEVRLYQKYSVGAERTFLLYYGHEIPEEGGESYDESGTGRVFNIGSLSRALRGFTSHLISPSHTIDLLVLSTCYNGSPCAISRLSPYAQYIIASPEYLHLSYMRNRLLDSLERLDRMSTADIARQFASRSFERLKQETETAITVVVYDTHKAASFLQGSAAQCDSLLTLLQSDTNPVTIHYYDWLENSALFRQGADDGVTVLYRPPEFGRMRQKSHHSGWEAWGLEDSQELGAKQEENVRK